MTEWWNTCAEAGPAEPQKSLEDMVKKPVLSFCAWPSEFGAAPVLPEAVLKKYDENDDAYGAWSKVCMDFEACRPHC